MWLLLVSRKTLNFFVVDMILLPTSCCLLFCSCSWLDLSSKIKLFLFQISQHDLSRNIKCFLVAFFAWFWYKHDVFFVLLLVVLLPWYAFSAYMNVFSLQYLGEFPWMIGNGLHFHACHDRKFEQKYIHFYLNLFSLYSSSIGKLKFLTAIYIHP